MNMREKPAKKNGPAFVTAGRSLRPLLAAAIPAGAIALNRRFTAWQLERIRRSLKDSYTPAEAEEAVRRVMGRYYGTEGGSVFFEDGVFHIDRSYMVFSRRDRLLICEILSRTDGFTGRTARNLSAEWLGHNVITYASLGRNRSAVHVDLDGAGDPRPYVSRVTRLMERLWMA